MGIKRVIRVGLLVLALAAACTTACTAHSGPSPTPTPSESIAGNGYSYGYGTYYVATRRSVSHNWGDAKLWYARAQAAGYEVGDTPKKGAIAWTDRGPYGQVAIVEEVSTDGKKVTISEMNGKDGWNKVTTWDAPAGSYGYIYIYH